MAKPPRSTPPEPDTDPRDDDYGLDDTTKDTSGDEEDDSQDLVDHMKDMLHSGRIDMDAYRGERNDDDEDGMLGPSGDDD